jgi:hypothetical protein
LRERKSLLRFTISHEVGVCDRFVTQRPRVHVLETRLDVDLDAWLAAVKSAGAGPRRPASPTAAPSPAAQPTPISDRPPVL